MVLKRFLAKIFFNILWIPIRLLVGLFVGFKILGKENLKDLRMPFIIVINHASWLDPFLVGAAFPFNSKFFPISYATWHKYYYFPLFFPLLFLLGTFPIKKGFGLDNALKEAIKVLRNGGVIGIFPEGKRRHFGRPRKGRRGAAYLVLNAGVPVLPVVVEGSLGLDILKFFLRKKRVIIKIGKSFYLPSEMKYPADLDEATDLIIDKLRSV